MPASLPSRAPHAQGNPPIHDSWVRNYESVDYDIPLLHPQAHLDSGDEEEDVKRATGQNKEGSRTTMPSHTDQPPRTPPKNLSVSPKSVKGNGNGSADPRLPAPARTPSHTRGPSFQSSTSSTPTKSAQQQTYSSPGQQLYASASGASSDKNQGAVADGQMGPGTIGSMTGGYVTELSHQSSLSTTTATAGGAAQTATPTSRSPRSSSFRSSPLAASASTSASGVKNQKSHPPPVSQSTIGIPPTSGSNSSSLLPSSSPPNAAMNTSPPMSSPHSMGASSSSSTPPSSFFQSGQGSSSTQHPPTMPNTPYSQNPHPNASNPPLAKPGTRPNPGSTNNNNNSHMNPAYMQRIASEESRVFGGPQVAAGQVAGIDGGSGRGSPHSQSGFMHTGGSGVGIGLRDPGSLSGNNNNNNINNQHPPHLNSSGSRGSMILYRLSATEDGILPPPGVPGSAGRRGSVYSNSGDSIVSLSGDSKYPLVGFGSGTRTPGTPGRPGTPGTPGNGSIGNRGGPLSMSEIGKVHGGLVAYMYDPGQDLDADELDEEEEEWVKNVGGHIPRGDLKGFGSFGNAGMRMKVNTGGKGKNNGKAPIRTSKHTPPPSSGVPWRGLVNVTTLVVLILGLLCLFLLYPVWRAYNNNGVEQLILGNTRINSTGQAVNLELDSREWKWTGFDRELQ